MGYHSGIEREHGFLGFRGCVRAKELLRSLRGFTHLVTSQGTNTIVGGGGGPNGPRVLHGALKCGVEWSVEWDECGVEWSETQWSGEWSGEWREITPRGCSYPM